MTNHLLQNPSQIGRQWDRYPINQIHYIDHMCRNYHSASLTLMEDELAFWEEGEFLKRFYFEDQWSHKIILLGDYYQYHQELPRLFPPDMQPIIQNYHEDIRAQEYKLVKHKMGDSQAPPQSSRQKTHRPVNKIIKNIELSYYNFQKKNVKKQKQSERPNNQLQEARSKGTLSKHKKSMPLLPYYQSRVQKDGKGKEVKVVGKESKKGSNNNSVQTPKALSRTKSKSNLPVHQKLPFRAQGKTHYKIQSKIQEKPEPKHKSNHCSLQRASSKGNINERKPLKECLDKNERTSVRKEGVKNMFKKAVQVKKPLKVIK